MTRPVALVTGGLRGIGLACAEALAGAGFDIFVADLASEATDQLRHGVERAGGRLGYVAFDLADLSSHAAVLAAIDERFGRIDCLVNNAGIGAPKRGDLLDLSAENFDTVLAINLRGTVFLSQAVARSMLRAFGDHLKSIVTITSISAEAASPERADYCMSKAALSMWVKTLALRLAPERIGVFEVRPGIIRTSMTAAVAGRYDELIGNGLVPARRWGEPADVADAVAMLASGRLSFATGSIINVDGALSIPRL